MVQLFIFCENKPAVAFNARRFPVRIGRSARNEVRLEDAGVWDQHLQIDLNPTQGFVLRAQPDALVTLNGHSVQEGLLCNGDIVQVGSVKLRFSLSETQQAGLRLREGLTWAAIAAVCLGQIALVYWLLR